MQIFYLELVYLQYPYTLSIHFIKIGHNGTTKITRQGFD